MAQLEALKRILKHMGSVADGASALRLKHIDDAASFEAIFQPLHAALSELTQLINASR